MKENLYNALNQAFLSLNSIKGVKDRQLSKCVKILDKLCKKYEHLKENKITMYIGLIEDYKRKMDKFDDEMRDMNEEIEQKIRYLKKIMEEMELEDMKKKHCKSCGNFRYIYM